MQKDFDNWNEKKKKINGRIFNNYVHTREVWWCSLGVNVGFEQDGKHNFFERPVLVVRKFSRDVVIIIPLSSKIKQNKYCLNFMHDSQEFSALISQVRLISTKRLNRKIYEMDPIIFNKIHESVRNII